MPRKRPYKLTKCILFSPKLLTTRLFSNFLNCFHLQLHLHSGTDEVLNVTFMRAPSHALIKVDVPLVFRGDDVCPGLRKGK